MTGRLSAKRTLSHFNLSHYSLSSSNESFAFLFYSLYQKLKPVKVGSVTRAMKICLDLICLDSICLDSICLDSICLDSICLDSICLDSICPGLSNGQGQEKRHWELTSSLS